MPETTKPDLTAALIKSSVKSNKLLKIQQKHVFLTLKQIFLFWKLLYKHVVLYIDGLNYN